MPRKESRLTSILAQSGPLTGAQLLARCGMEVLSLWQMCHKTPSVLLRSIARRFLRLDRAVNGFARLSPSIRREFLTYTYVALKGQEQQLEEKSQALKEEIKQISKNKLRTAHDAVVSTIDSFAQKDVLLQAACFLIAGDVVYDMAHTVPRPEKSTGEMVLGSDLDIIVIVEDEVDPAVVQAFDASFHKRKHLLLVNEREEIDYLIKTMSRVREQLRFDTFPSMVACKILHESRLLHGNPVLYQTVRDLLAEHGITQQLEELEREATAKRSLAEAQLLKVNPEKDQSEYYNLFYTHAEEDEIY